MNPPSEHPPGHRPWKASEGTHVNHTKAGRMVHACSMKLRRAFTPKDTLDDDYPPPRISFIEQDKTAKHKHDSFLDNEFNDMMEDRMMEKDFNATADTARLENLLAAVQRPNPRRDVNARNVAQAEPTHDLDDLSSYYSDSPETASTFQLQRYNHNAAMSKRRSMQSAMSFGFLIRDLENTHASTAQGLKPRAEPGMAHHSQRGSVASSSIAPPPIVRKHAHAGTNLVPTRTVESSRTSLWSLDSLAPPDIRRQPRRSGVSRPATKASHMSWLSELSTEYQPVERLRRQVFDAQRVPLSLASNLIAGHTSKPSTRGRILAKDDLRRGVLDRKPRLQDLDYRPRLETETIVHKNSVAPTLRSLLAPWPVLEIPRSSMPTKRLSVKPKRSPNQSVAAILAPTRRLSQQSTVAPKQRHRLSLYPRQTEPTAGRRKPAKVGGEGTTPSATRPRTTEMRQSAYFSHSTHSCWDESSSEGSATTALPTMDAVRRSPRSSHTVGRKVKVFGSKVRAVVISTLKGPEPPFSPRGTKAPRKLRSNTPSTVMDGAY